MQALNFRSKASAITHRCVGAVFLRCDISNIKRVHPNDFFYFDDIITDDDEKQIIILLNSQLKRRKYEGNHWDDIITKYKETNIQTDLLVNPLIQRVLSNCQTIINSAVKKDIKFLPPHVIDLAEDGFISPHVDSIKFSGDLIAGLSLLSPRILRLQPSEENSNILSEPSFEVVVQPRSLYILKGKLRYDYAHAILGPLQPPALLETSTEFQMSSISRRLSVMFRDELP